MELWKSTLLIVLLVISCIWSKWKWISAQSSRHCGHVLTFIFSEIRIKEVMYSWFIHRILQILPPERIHGSLTIPSLPFRDICVPWQLFILWVMGGVCYLKTENWFALCLYIHPYFRKLRVFCVLEFQSYKRVEIALKGKKNLLEELKRWF